MQRWSAGSATGILTEPERPGKCNEMKGQEVVGEELGKVAGGQLMQGYGS